MANILVTRLTCLLSAEIARRAGWISKNSLRVFGGNLVSNFAFRSSQFSGKLEFRQVKTKFSEKGSAFKGLSINDNDDIIKHNQNHNICCKAIAITCSSLCIIHSECLEILKSFHTYLSANGGFHGLNQWRYKWHAIVTTPNQIKIANTHT